MLLRSSLRAVSYTHLDVYKRQKFDWLSATGTAILFAALLSIVWLRMKPKDALTTFAGTLKDVYKRQVFSSPTSWVNPSSS